MVRILPDQQPLPLPRETGALDRPLCWAQEAGPADPADTSAAPTPAGPSLLQTRPLPDSGRGLFSRGRPRRSPGVGPTPSTRLEVGEPEGAWIRGEPVASDPGPSGRAVLHRSMLGSGHVPSWAYRPYDIRLNLRRALTMALTVNSKLLPTARAAEVAAAAGRDSQPEGRHWTPLEVALQDPLKASFDIAAALPCDLQSAHRLLGAGSVAERLLLEVGRGMPIPQRCFGG